jgi:hypothetical protein
MCSIIVKDFQNSFGGKFADKEKRGGFGGCLMPFHNNFRYLLKHERC